ncbi:hypothetical protein [Neobacillus sp. FSL H8-0543]|uniref:hypothetical protein n=1 Tax=Neobacillus sp. FSL H8-0543 TaxID=2954672 RepID=UPI0031589232
MRDILWFCYLGILAIASIGMLINGGNKTYLGKLDFVFSFITWIGLFGYVTDNQILTPLVWKIVFVCGLFWDVILSFKKFNEETRYEAETQSIKLLIFVIPLIFLLGPLYFGLFNYAF